MTRTVPSPNPGLVSEPVRRDTRPRIGRSDTSGAGLRVI